MENLAQLFGLNTDAPTKEEVRRVLQTYARGCGLKEVEQFAEQAVEAFDNNTYPRISRLVSAIARSRNSFRLWAAMAALEAAYFLWSNDSITAQKWVKQADGHAETARQLGEQNANP